MFRNKTLKFLQNFFFQM